MISKVGIVLPIYCGANKEFQQRVTKFVDRLVHLSNVDNLEFLINIQTKDANDYEWIKDKFNNIASTYNSTWTFKYKESGVMSTVSMVNIRNECLMLNPELELYCFVDDDVYYNKGSGDCYNEIIEYFNQDPNLGLVMSSGFLGGYRYVHKLKYAVVKAWCTQRGLFLRSKKSLPSWKDEKSPLFHHLALENCIGGGEEYIASVEQICEGRLAATAFNNPATHKICGGMFEGSKDCYVIKNKKKYDFDGEDQIHKKDIAMPTISKYLNLRFPFLKDTTIDSLTDENRILAELWEYITKKDTV